MRTIVGKGAMGSIVKEVQSSLTSVGFSPGPCDGVYGNGTVSAVRNFQTSFGLTPSGAIDDSTWQPLLKKPIPSVGERALALTASFEGHGFELAVGNFDGALLTWGIIGFTLASGEIPEMINEINSTRPDLISTAFSTYSSELLTIIRVSRDQQTAWANQHTTSNGQLAEPWKSMFAEFGSYPEVQQVQIKRAENDYLVPAINAAKNLGLESELALALLFDIHVQNGGIKKSVLASITQSRTSSMTESDVLQLIANGVADSASAKWREDVRTRKLTIAMGQGTVHGHSYLLENWGLSVQIQAAELLQTLAAVPA